MSYLIKCFAGFDGPLNRESDQLKEQVILKREGEREGSISSHTCLGISTNLLCDPGQVNLILQKMGGWDLEVPAFCIS